MSLQVQNGGRQVAEVDSIKFLGIALDKHCTWRDHIDNVCNRINRYSYVLWRLANVSTLKTALMAYHGYVASILTYGVVMWGNSPDIQRAFVAQKRCIRALFKVSSTTSCKPLFQKLNVMSLPCIYIYEMCKFVRMHPYLFDANKNVLSGNYKLRRPNDLMFPKMRTTLFSNNCYAMAIRIFNKLPNELKMLPLHKFKIELRTRLIRKCFYNVKEYLDNTKPL